MGDEVHNEMFQRLGKVEQNLAATNGKLDVLIGQNDKLLKLVALSTKWMGGALIFAILAIIYGALGPNGFNAVKSTVPTIHASDVR